MRKYQEANQKLGVEAAALFYFCLLAAFAGCIWLLFISEHPYSLGVTVAAAVMIPCIFALMVGGIPSVRERIRNVQEARGYYKSNA